MIAELEALYRSRDKNGAEIKGNTAQGEVRHFMENGLTITAAFSDSMG